jgi:regulatory protein YycI of two-component signal transduction system YycFG
MKTIKSLLILLFFGKKELHMHKKQCKSETNVNFNADKITLSAKGREDANYELTFTAQTKAEEKAF